MIDKMEIKCKNCGFHLRFYKGHIGDIPCPMCKETNTILDGLSDVGKERLIQVNQSSLRSENQTKVMFNKFNPK